MNLVERYTEMVKAQKEGAKIDASKRISLREALSTPDLSQLVQKTVIDVMRDSAEPVYLGSNLFKKVRITEGRSIIFPSMAAIRAHEVPEGGNYPEETMEVQLHEAQLEVKVQKVGLMVRVTDEMIDDAQWDVIGIMLQKAGQAMARHKEEKAFREFSRHGHIIFDADSADEKLKVHGLDFNATENKTMNDEDFFDMFLGLMANEYVPTDVFMHPLVWPMFAKNALLEKLPLAAFGGSNNSISITPDAVNGRLPFALSVTLSPFVPFDRVNKKFDMFVLDRNEIGCLLVKDELSTEQWDNPERDIQNIKVKERYGFGIFNNGKAICSAKNIAFAKTYPMPQRVKQI
jgi:hypothetical protein